MLDLATLVLGAGSAMGVAALLATDPIVIRKAYVPRVVEYYQGYSGELIAKLLRERIRTIAREASTSRGDYLGVFNKDESAIDTLTKRLHVDGVVDALREFLNLQLYSIDPYLVQTPDGIKLGMKGEAADGELFFIYVKGAPYEDITVLIDRLAQRFIEKVDPYVLTLYYFRQEYGKGEFTQSLPMIEHSIRVLPIELKVWPLLLRGRIHYRLGEYDEAILKYQEALRIDPDFDLAIARWGEVLIDQGYTKEGLEKMQLAIVMSNKAVSESPVYRNVKYKAAVPILYTLLGDNLVKIDADEAARAVYVQGLEQVPDDPLLQTSLGALYLRHGQFEPAVSLLQQALLTHPDPTVPQKLLDQAMPRSFVPPS